MLTQKNITHKNFIQNFHPKNFTQKKCSLKKCSPNKFSSKKIFTQNFFRTNKFFTESVKLVSWSNETSPQVSKSLKLDSSTTGTSVSSQTWRRQIMWQRQGSQIAEAPGEESLPNRSSCFSSSRFAFSGPFQLFSDQGLEVVRRIVAREEHRLAAYIEVLSNRTSFYKEPIDIHCNHL